MKETALNKSTDRASGTEATLTTQVGRQGEELAYRENGGIAVSLRWNRETGDVSVFVEESELGESFVVPAEPEQAPSCLPPPLRLRACPRRSPR